MQSRVDSKLKDTFLEHFKPLFETVFRPKLHDIISKAKIVAANLKLYLHKRYAKELKPEHKPFVLDPHKDRHRAKSASARRLYAALCGRGGIITMSQHSIDDFSDLAEIQRFINVFRAEVKLNKSLQPSAEKCGGGVYGSILSKQHDSVESLAYELDEHVRNCINALAEYTKFFQAHLAYLNQYRQLVDAKSDSGLIGEYLDYKLYDIKTTLGRLFEFDEKDKRFAAFSKLMDDDSYQLIQIVNNGGMLNERVSLESYLKRLIREVSIIELKYKSFQNKDGLAKSADLKLDLSVKRSLDNLIFDLESQASIIFLKRYLGYTHQSKTDIYIDSAKTRRMELAKACYSHGKLHTGFADGLHADRTYSDPFMLEHLKRDFQIMSVRLDDRGNVDTGSLETIFERYLANLDERYADDNDMKLVLSIWKDEFAKIRGAVLAQLKSFSLVSRGVTIRSLLLFAHKQKDNNPFTRTPENVVSYIGDLATRTEPRM